MNTAKIYKDSEGNECSIGQMIEREPYWAANRLQEGEKAIEKLEELNSLISSLIVEEECDICSGEGEHPLLGPEYNKCELTSKCMDCQGTGKVTRPATWEDIDIVKLVDGHYGFCSSGEKSIYVPENPGAALTLTTKSGGILKLRS